MRIDSVLLGILALIAGVLILFHWLSSDLVVGIFLVVYGIITLIRR